MLLSTSDTTGSANRTAVAVLRWHTRLNVSAACRTAAAISALSRHAASAASAAASSGDVLATRESGDVLLSSAAPSNLTERPTVLALPAAGGEAKAASSSTGMGDIAGRPAPAGLAIAAVLSRCRRGDAPADHGVLDSQGLDAGVATCPPTPLAFRLDCPALCDTSLRRNKSRRHADTSPATASMLVARLMREARLSDAMDCNVAAMDAFTSRVRVRSSRSPAAVSRSSVLTVCSASCNSARCVASEPMSAL